MSHLVERLRKYKRDRSGYAEYCHQAADEIERLRAELAEARELLREARRSVENRAAQLRMMSEFQQFSEHGREALRTAADWDDDVLKRIDAALKEKP